MLYERWLNIAHERKHERALTDLGSGADWSFAELMNAAERGVPDDIVLARGHTYDFVRSVLGAWRHGRPLCPLEESQDQPRLSGLPKNCAHLKTTSATTGKPRFVVFTAEQLFADASNIVETMGLRADWPNLGAISMAHSYGFSNLVLPLLLFGIPLFLVPSPLPEAIKKAAACGSEFSLPSVPALWRTWHEAGVITESIRLAISAGAPLPASLENRIFNASGVKVHNFYGSTECGGIAYDASESVRNVDNFAGAPMANVTLSVDEDDCLSVHSRAVGETYWPQPSPNLGNGRFKTSDLAELTDGTLFLKGRLGDTINVAGRKLVPESVEGVLRDCSGVKDCLVLGVSDERSPGSETVAAVVVAERGIDPAVLRGYLLERLPAWQVPKRWHFTESIAPNRRGKVSRKEWRRVFK
ncbi:MAG: fatty acid--CoA ligase family protein [Verrucomicrobia bacterium]|nr:fatty acid--CoA ligase family protein [Verrucomicrobiota bacterium]MCF7708614.1 fatty acid--CoA ligase family protein [Verrucomicrobiota bacterium]